MSKEGEVCDFGTKICKVNKSCLRLKSYASSVLKLSVADEVGGSFDLQFPFSEMVLSGTVFGEDDNWCHITVYDHEMRSSPQKRIFYVGARYF